MARRRGLEIPLEVWELSQFNFMEEQVTASKILVLPKPKPLPTRNRWTHRAIAEYLQASRNTVKLYAEQIAPTIRDFYNDCPKDRRGFITSGFSLTQYQFWVIVKLIGYARLLKADLKGAAYRETLKHDIEIGAIYFSKASYQYELEILEEQSA